MPVVVGLVAAPVDVKVGVDDGLWVVCVLVIVTGIEDPLLTGKTVRVEQIVPDFLGHTSDRFNCLSNGPVGPDIYSQVIFRFSRLTCLGSLSGYCSSPQRPR